MPASLKPPFLFLDARKHLYSLTPLFHKKKKKQSTP